MHYFQHREIIQIENQQEMLYLIHILPNGLNKYIQNIPTNSSKIHIPYKHTWILSRRDLMVIHKTRLSKYKRIKITPSIFLCHTGYETRNQLQEKLETSQICGN